MLLFLFQIIDLKFLIPAAIAQISNSIVETVIPIVLKEIPINSNQRSKSKNWNMSSNCRS